MLVPICRVVVPTAMSLPPPYPHPSPMALLHKCLQVSITSSNLILSTTRACHNLLLFKIITRSLPNSFLQSTMSMAQLAATRDSTRNHHSFGHNIKDKSNIHSTHRKRQLPLRHRSHTLLIHNNSRTCWASSTRRPSIRNVAPGSVSSGSSFAPSSPSSRLR